MTAQEARAIFKKSKKKDGGAKYQKALAFIEKKIKLAAGAGELKTTVSFTHQGLHGLEHGDFKKLQSVLEYDGFHVAILMQEMIIRWA